MKVEPFVPDLASPERAEPAPSAGGFAAALDAVGTLLGGAQGAEDAFASGGGSLHAAVYERARADVALAVATAAAQRGAQALTTVLNMQV